MKLIKEEKENNNIKKVKIVANLPYYITTPIIMKLLESKLDIRKHNSNDSKRSGR